MQPQIPIILKGSPIVAEMKKINLNNQNRIIVLWTVPRHNDNNINGVGCQN